MKSIKSELWNSVRKPVYTSVSTSVWNFIYNYVYISVSTSVWDHVRNSVTFNQNQVRDIVNEEC